MINVFLHIPKTGGTTLKDLLARSVGKQNVITWYGANKFKQGIHGIPQHVKPHTQWIIGHFNYGLHELLDQDVRYFCVLRDPIERLISNYEFTRSRTPMETDDHSVLNAAKHMDIIYFVAAHPGLHNEQTRYLSGTHSNDLELAFKHLDSVITGVQDFLPDYIANIQKICHLKRRPLIWRNQSGKSWKDIYPDNIRDELSLFVNKDIALYNQVKNQVVKTTNPSTKQAMTKEPLYSRLINLKAKLFS